ncbi:hypothetical protein THAOC_35144, partial [Thalassiosira oceanica]
RPGDNKLRLSYWGGFSWVFGIATGSMSSLRALAAESCLAGMAPAPHLSSLFRRGDRAEGKEKIPQFGWPRGGELGLGE